MFTTRRILFWSTICLVFGCIVNVAVAWRMALRSSTYRLNGGTVRINVRPAGSPPSLADIPVYISHQKGFDTHAAGSQPGYAWLFDREVAMRIAEGEHAEEIRSPTPSTESPIIWPSWLPFPPADGSKYAYWSGGAAGWPLFSMAFYSFVREGEEKPHVRWGIELDKAALSRANTTIPLKPIPLGFLFNSAVFAVVFALPFVLIRLARLLWRRRRIRAGQCLNCGYSLAGLPIAAACPECNTLVAVAP